MSVFPVQYFLIFFAVWLAALTFLNLWLYIYYRKLVQGVKKKDLFSVLSQLNSDLKKNETSVGELSQKLTVIEKQILVHLQKVGLIRFNPFDETGGDQSFCLALLDGENDGLVISSLHHRDGTRIYAKPIKKGQGAVYALSAEEKKAVESAQKIKK